LDAHDIAVLKKRFSGRMLDGLIRFHVIRMRNRHRHRRIPTYIRRRGRRVCV